MADGGDRRGAALHEMRLFKRSADLDALKAAMSITEEAHLRAMQPPSPGMHEYEVEALLLADVPQARVRPPGVRQHRRLRPQRDGAPLRQQPSKIREPGDLVLIDAGCEYDSYTGDVTRTLPASGRFTPAQRGVYDVVLRAQLGRSRWSSPASRSTSCTSTACAC